MAVWSIKPEWKKSIIERQHLTKGDNTLVIETGWRWGEFQIVTEDDNPPVLEEGVDLFDCGYDCEMIYTDDGCWEDHDYGDCDDETSEWLENFFDEGGSWLDLEEHGWTIDDCKMSIDCNILIEKVEE